MLLKKYIVNKTIIIKILCLSIFLINGCSFASNKAILAEQKIGDFSRIVLIVDQRKKDSSRIAGAAVMNLVRENIRPSDILTKKAFENAVTLVVAMGGSTNTALHLPAIANEMGIKLTLKEIHDISMRTPLLADMKPGGKYVVHIPLYVKLEDDFLATSRLLESLSHIYNFSRDFPERKKGENQYIEIHKNLQNNSQINEMIKQFEKQALEEEVDLSPEIENFLKDLEDN